LLLRRLTEHQLVDERRVARCGQQKNLQGSLAKAELIGFRRGKNA
jgi:hypothetical protein